VNACAVDAMPTSVVPAGGGSGCIHQESGEGHHYFRKRSISSSVRRYVCMYIAESHMAFVQVQTAELGPRLGEAQDV